MAGEASEEGGIGSKVGEMPAHQIMRGFVGPDKCGKGIGFVII